MAMGTIVLGSNIMVVISNFLLLFLLLNSNLPLSNLYVSLSKPVDLSHSAYSGAGNTTGAVPEWGRDTLAQAEVVYQRNLQMRQAASDFINGTLADSQTYYIRPLYPCPVEGRLGGWRDGGKWMCLLPSYVNKRPPVVYSIGCLGVVDFELDVWNTYKTKTFTFDPTLAPEVLANVQSLQYLSFYNIGLTGLDDLDAPLKKLPYVAPGAKMMQIEQIMAMLGHDFVDVFKIDCEGCEMEVIDKLSKTHTKEKPLFGQILIEVHWYPLLVQSQKILEKIESLGYRMYHAEPNFYYKEGFELSYIHESLLKAE